MAYLGHPENPVCVYEPAANTTVSATHLLWVGYRWIEATATSVDIGDGREPAWTFKIGRDARDWLRA